MRFSEIPLRFLLLKSESNLENHIRWMAYLAGADFVNDWKKSIQTGGHMQQMIQAARDIVDELIYAFSTGDSTGKLRESFTGKYLDASLPAFAIYSDPRVAPSKGPFSSGNPSSFSYAAFFEDPEFNSFIPDRENPTETRRYRPFFDTLSLDQQTQSHEIVFSSLMQTIRRRMPRV
jgi:hypothetical protein